MLKMKTKALIHTKIKSEMSQPESFVKTKCQGFPDGAVVKNLPANAGDTGSSPVPGRSHMPRSN